MTNWGKNLQRFFAEVWPNLQRFGQFCRGFENFAEVLKNFPSFGQICRGWGKFHKLDVKRLNLRKNSLTQLCCLVRCFIALTPTL